MRNHSGRFRSMDSYPGIVLGEMTSFLNWMYSLARDSKLPFEGIDSARSASIFNTSACDGFLSNIRVMVFLLICLRTRYDPEGSFSIFISRSSGELFDNVSHRILLLYRYNKKRRQNRPLYDSRTLLRRWLSYRQLMRHTVAHLNSLTCP